MCINIGILHRDLIFEQRIYNFCSKSITRKIQLITRAAFYMHQAEYLQEFHLVL